MRSLTPPCHIGAPATARPMLYLSFTSIPIFQRVSIDLIYFGIYILSLNKEGNELHRDLQATFDKWCHGVFLGKSSHFRSAKPLYTLVTIARGTANCSLNGKSSIKLSAVSMAT